MRVRPIFIISLSGSIILLISVCILNMQIDFGDRIQILMVIATFLAVLIALFQENIKRYFDIVRLTLEINLTPPDCHQIDITNEINGQFICKCIYLRIRVTNIGDITARNIEILASNLWRIENNTRTIVKTFLPMNLRWSHTHPTQVTMPTKSFRFCDLGPVRLLNNNVILKFDMETQPNPVSGGVYPNIIFPGKYILEILLSGENVYPEITHWEIAIPDKWSNDEDTMLKEIKIKKNNK